MPQQREPKGPWRAAPACRYAEEAEIDDSATASHAAGAGHQAAPEPNSIDDLVGAGKYDDEEEAYMGGQLAAEGGGATLDEDHKPLESRVRLGPSRVLTCGDAMGLQNSERGDHHGCC